MSLIGSRLGRRGALAALAAAAWGLAAALLPGQASAQSLGSAVIFGDSFSTPTFSSVTNWSKQLADARVITVTSNRAAAGTLASSTSTTSLLGRVQAYLATNPTLPTFTIIYAGTEDLQRGLSVAAAKRGVTRAVNELVERGANVGTKRIILVQPHDVTLEPGVTVSRRAAVVEFNNNIKRLARSRPNIRTVDLGTLFDRVRASPSSFGLTNVTTPSASASATTALYFDSLHFGRKGQSIIAAEIRRVLSAR